MTTALRARPRRTLLSVPTVADLPTLTDNPMLWYVGTSPPQLWLTDSDGQRQLGWSAHAASTADLTLGVAQSTTESDAADITGATVTLPKPGTYIIVAVFDITSVTGVASTAVGILREADNTVVDTPRGAIYNPGATGDRVTVTQTYRFTTTTDNEVLKLSAYQTSAVNNAFTVNQTHTTITASSFLGGDETASTHTHTHDSATSRTEDDHHLGFVGLGGDGSPVVPDASNRINIKAGAGVTITPTANDITIAATGGGGGVGPHELLSASHPDTVIGTPAKGDLVVGAGSSLWQQLAAGSVGDVLFTGNANTVGWVGLSGLASGIDHGLLAGLGDDDHPQYANQTNTEVISGEWTWETFLQYAAVSAPSAPAEDHMRMYLVKDGANLILRGIGPTGAVCDICTLANVVVAHTNILTLNWME